MSHAWFQNAFKSLMEAPGPISIPKLPFGMRGGPGPIDVFSTRFYSLFADDVSATVNGEAVDKEGLKGRLVKIKRRYNMQTAQLEEKVQLMGREVLPRVRALQEAAA